jgi:hypothetical protein
VAAVVAEVQKSYLVSGVQAVVVTAEPRWATVAAVVRLLVIPVPMGSAEAVAALVETIFSLLTHRALEAVQAVQGE